MKTLGHPADKRVIVLDTSAFVAGLDPFSIGEEQYTVPSVRNEIPEDSVLNFRFKTAEENGRIRVKTPSAWSLEEARKSASAVGDTHFLSETDLELLALAVELKNRGYRPLIATDDYSIQNVAKQLQIEFAPLTTFGIRRRLEWLRYCPACRKTFPTGYKSSKCEVCGTDLKRKPVKRESEG